MSTAGVPETGPESIERRLAPIAARQYDIFSRTQAVGAGATKGIIQRRVTLGRWEQVARDVFTIAGVPRTWRQSLMATHLAWGDGSALSHCTAAALLALPGVKPGTIEISVPRTRKRTPGEGVTVHRPRDLRSADITTVGGIPVTTAARTLIDIAALVDNRILEDGLDDALRRGLVSIPRLLWRISELEAAGASFTSPGPI